MSVENSHQLVLPSQIDVLLQGIGDLSHKHETAVRIGRSDTRRAILQE